VPFALALFAIFTETVLSPTWRLSPFIPFLAILYMRCGFVKALWLAALCGLILDLLNSELRFGLCAVTYTLVTLIAYRQKRHFFDDKPLALSLYTALISCIATLVHFLFLYFAEKPFSKGGKWILSDFFVMPLCDAALAFVWFTLPIMLYSYVQRVGWVGLWQKVRGLWVAP